MAKAKFDANQVRALYDDGKSYEEIRAITGICQNNTISRLLKATGGTRLDKKEICPVAKVKLPAMMLPESIANYYAEMSSEELSAILIAAYEKVAQSENNEQTERTKEEETKSTVDVEIPNIETEKQNARIAKSDVVRMSVTYYSKDRELETQTIFAYPEVEQVRDIAKTICNHIEAVSAEAKFEGGYFSFSMD